MSIAIGMVYCKFHSRLPSHSATLFRSANNFSPRYVIIKMSEILFVKIHQFNEIRIRVCVCVYLYNYSFHKMELNKRLLVVIVYESEVIISLKLKTGIFSFNSQKQSVHSILFRSVSFRFSILFSTAFNIFVVHFSFSLNMQFKHPVSSII